MTKHPDWKKLLSGATFFVIGIIGTILSLRFDIGTVSRLGPGGFPLLLNMVLIVLGFAGMAVGVLSGSGEGLGKWPMKAIILICLSAVAFGFVVERWGLVPAIVVCVLIGGFANPTTRVVEIVIMCIALAVFGAGLFVYGLGLPFSLFIAE